MCNARPLAGGRMIEPLEPRRLLSAAPTPFNPLDLPGAYERPDGSIVVPNSSLDAPAAPATPAAAPDDTAGFFSTTSPRSKSTSAVSWDTQPHASPSGTAQAANNGTLPGDELHVRVSSSYTFYCGYTEITSYGGGQEEHYHCTGQVQDGYLAFTAASCNIGGTAPSSVTVGYDLGGTATPGTDYDGGLTSGSVEVPRDMTVLKFFHPKKDNLVEGTESVTVTIRPGGYIIGQATATSSLTDDPPVVDLTGGGTVIEDNSGGGASFTVTRSGGNIAGSLQVNSNVPPSQATPYDDFEVKIGNEVRPDLPSSIVFAPGETSKTIQIIPKDDPDYEGTETLNFGLAPGTYLFTGSNGGSTTTQPAPKTAGIKDEAPELKVTLDASSNGTASAAGDATFHDLGDVEGLDASLSMSGHIGGANDPSLDATGSIKFKADDSPLAASVDFAASVNQDGPKCNFTVNVNYIIEDVAFRLSGQYNQDAEFTVSGSAIFHIRDEIYLTLSLQTSPSDPQTVTAQAQLEARF